MSSMRERASCDSAGMNGKRKREDVANDRKKKERKVRSRQEEMQEEFSATYQGLTALYKLLEIQHLESPLFLPRTLSYRLEAKSQGPQLQNQSKEGKPSRNARRQASGSKKTSNAQRRGNPVDANLHDWKVSMTSKTVEALKKANRRIGVLISIWKGTGKSFKDNEFDLLASCVVPVPFGKSVQMGAPFFRHLGVHYLVMFQVVDLGEQYDELSKEESFMFEEAEKGSRVVGKELLANATRNYEPLFGGLLQLSPFQRRNGTYQVHLDPVNGSSNGVVKVEFRIAWDKDRDDSKSLRVANILQRVSGTDFLLSGSPALSSILSTPKPISSFQAPKSSDKPCVWFHYLYHMMLRRMSEQRNDFTCVWCNMYAGSLRGLVAHLVSSHSRFRFQVALEHDNVPHIYVMATQSVTQPEAASSEAASICELQLDNDKDADRIEHHFRYISSRKWCARGAQDAGALDNCMKAVGEVEDITNQKPETYQLLKKRQYFHSRTGALVLDHEKDYDSDDDVDEEWIIQQSEKLLDEFEDVALEEKEFMKRWNRHVRENKILADFMVASSCRLFAKNNGRWLIEHGLRYNFLLHLFNLWDNSLLNARAIIDCMLIVDHHEVLEQARKEKEQVASEEKK